jgi:HEAT repeat protein
MSATKYSVDKESLAKSLEALKKFDWGKDRGQLMAIEQTVPAVHSDPEVGIELEALLAPMLGTQISLAAKDYIVRQLLIIATPKSLPALTALLTDKELSHRARMVIERMPFDEAGQALRESLTKVSPELKVGVIGSLGNRRDAASVAALGELVGDSDPLVAKAAATALGDIGTVEAAKALEAAAAKASADVKPRVGDGLLACAERLSRDGDKTQAKDVYKAIEAIDLPKAVKKAATRGKLMVG